MEQQVNCFPGRQIILNGEKHLYFGGTAYLGLQTDPDFQDIFIKNIKKFGTNYGASRKANVQIMIYGKTESYLAKLIGSQSCLTLSSGYLAGQIVSRYFHNKGHRSFYAPGTHGALHLLGTKNYRNTEQLILKLNESIASTDKSPVLFFESIDIAGKNYPDFDWLKKLPLDKLILVVDDSHGLGIIGQDGGGVFRSLEKFKCKELIVCGSLGKGFAVHAGVVAGGDRLIKELKDSYMFAAASPASPAALATLLASSELLVKKRKLLFENIDYFLGKLDETAAFDYMPKYPSFAFDHTELPPYLLKDNIVITNFNYPTDKDPVVQRIVLSAHHTMHDLDRLIFSLNSYFPA